MLHLYTCVCVCVCIDIVCVSVLSWRETLCEERERKKKLRREGGRGMRNVASPMEDASEAQLRRSFDRDLQQVESNQYEAQLSRVSLVAAVAAANAASATAPVDHRLLQQQQQQQQFSGQMPIDDANARASALFSMNFEVYSKVEKLLRLMFELEVVVKRAGRMNTSWSSDSAGGLSRRERWKRRVSRFFANVCRQKDSTLMHTVSPNASVAFLSVCRTLIALIIELEAEVKYSAQHVRWRSRYDDSSSVAPTRTP